MFRLKHNNSSPLLRFVLFSVSLFVLILLVPSNPEDDLLSNLHNRFFALHHDPRGSRTSCPHTQRCPPSTSQDAHTAGLAGDAAGKL